MRGGLAERPGREGGGGERVSVTVQAGAVRAGERKDTGASLGGRLRSVELSWAGLGGLWCFVLVGGVWVAGMEIVCCRLPVVFLFLVGEIWLAVNEQRAGPAEGNFVSFFNASQPAS